MTKKEKDKIRQECAEGKHAFTAEFLIKQREKEERQAKKRQQLRNYVIDEQDKQLIADCEACMANPYAWMDDIVGTNLTDEQMALIDDVVEEYKKLHKKAS